MPRPEANGIELRSGKRLNNTFPRQRVAARAEYISMRSEKGASKIPNNDDQIDPLLTIDDVCALLKLEPQTIYQLTYRGRIPHFKIANRLRFRLSEIADWIEKHKVAKASEENFRQRV